MIYASIILLIAASTIAAAMTQKTSGSYDIGTPLIRLIIVLAGLAAALTVTIVWLLL